MWYLILQKSFSKKMSLNFFLKNIGHKILFQVATEKDLKGTQSAGAHAH